MNTLKITSVSDIPVTKLIKIENYRARGTENSLRILVAEDNKNLAFLLKITLEKQGHEVLAIAENGRIAVELALRHRPDIVLMDIDMPELDGISASAEILNEYSCPIIFTTGRTDASTLKRSKLIESQAFLVKPFTPEQLKAGIETAIEMHRKSLSAELEISKLRAELGAIHEIEHVIKKMVLHYNIDREEALQQLGMMAETQGSFLLDAAQHALKLIQESKR